MSILENNRSDENDRYDLTISNKLGLQQEENDLKALEKYFKTASSISAEDKYEKLYLKSERLRRLMRKRYQQKYRQMKRTIDRLQKTVSDQCSRVGKIFNEDQFDIVSGKYKKCPRWHDNTLVKSFKLKFACGVSGYKEIMKQGIPLPSIRTLQRQLENWDFKSGIIEEAFDFLKIKIPFFKDEIYVDSLLVIDEVGITPGKIFDCSTKSYVGFVTLGDNKDSTELADHGLVFMLAGISHRWKQPVAYYYTNQSTSGYHYYQVVRDIIKKAENIGLKVHGVVSDMGSANQALWSQFKISAGRYSPINNKCKHPLDNNRYLYFFHDTAHAFKNFKEGMLSNKVITIPEEFKIKYDLPSNEVNAAHLEELLQAQDHSELLLAPHLKEEYVSGKRHFRKMRVENTSRAVSHEVSSAIEYLADEISKPEYKTTAWLFKTFNKWWDISGCRNLKLALSKLKLDEYKSTISFLNEFIELVTNMKVGKKGQWKPFQTGILITTKSIIELSAFLLNNRKYKFVMAGRFSQDCLENIFSALRVRNPVLNALQFKNNLKIVSVSSYMKDTSTSSYKEDDREFLPDFLKVVRKKKPRDDSDNIEIPELQILDKTALSKVDLNILHHIAGYLIMSIAKKQKLCKRCIPQTGCFKASVPYYSKLTSLRCYKQDTLFFVNQNTFHFFIEMELIFRTYFSTVYAKRGLNLKMFFVNKFSKLVYSIPDCHKLKKAIMSRFASFRLKIKSNKLKKVNNNTMLSSKTMYMHYNTV